MEQFDLTITGNVVLNNAIIEEAYIAVKDGIIVEIGQGEPPDAGQAYNRSGAFLMPGGVDSQVHSLSQAGREGFAWSTKSAAGGGVTTIVDMPYDDGGLICNADRFKAKVEDLQSNARVDVALYATIDPQEGTARIPELVRAGAAGFKFSTYGTDPRRFPRIPNYLLLECFKAIRPYGLIAGVHNENEEAVNHYTAEVVESGVRDWQAHAMSRPPVTELLAMAEIYELAALSGCRVHVVHCSLGRGYEMCAGYRRMGADTTAEACIHYLTLTHEEHAPRLKGLCKINPPIRPEAEVEKLWHHLAAGNITVVSTDHVSWSKERKNDPDMLKNASGAPGLEALYPLLLTGCKTHGVPFSTAARVLSYNPARLFNLHHRKGSLEVGKDADIAIFEASPYVYNPRQSRNNISDWSPYEGMTLNYRVTQTFLRGKLIFDGSRVHAGKGNGQFLRPQVV